MNIIKILFAGGHLLNAPNFTIQFTKSTVFEATSNRIPPGGEFEITGQLLQTSTGWEYQANVTKPEINHFSGLVLRTLTGKIRSGIIERILRTE